MAHTLITKQHLITLEMCAPDDVDVNQVIAIKDACAAAGVTGAFIGNVSGGIAAFEACVRATELFSGLVTQKLQRNLT